jgi:heat shock protein HslJ
MRIIEVGSCPFNYAAGMIAQDVHTYPESEDDHMKAIVGFAFFLLFLAGFAFVMMMGREAAEQNMAGGGASLTGVHWRLASVGGDVVPDDSGMFITFDVDGSIKGHGGCNRFFGSLEKTETGLKIGPLGATRMACPEAIMRREAKFHEVLQESHQFRTDGSSLRLLGAEDNVLAEFIANEE